MGEEFVPDYCEPIIGWRFWHYHDGEGLRLVSNGGFLWQPFQKAIASHHAHADSPAYTCRSSPCRHGDAEGGYGWGCGFYALKTREGLLRWLVGSHHFYSKCVIGTVKLWGRVEFHREGYRAEFAYPERLVAAGGNHRTTVAAMLAKVYGVPCEEDASWISDLKSLRDQSSWSPWSTQFPNQSQLLQNQLQHLSPSPIVYWSPPFPPPNTTISTSLRQLVQIAAPAKKGEILQPSFNLHKPLGWFFDKALGIYRRLEGKRERRKV